MSAWYGFDTMHIQSTRARRRMNRMVPLVLSAFFNTAQTPHDSDGLMQNAPVSVASGLVGGRASYHRIERADSLMRVARIPKTHSCLFTSEFIQVRKKAAMLKSARSTRFSGVILDQSRIRVVNVVCTYECMTPRHTARPTEEQSFHTAACRPVDARRGTRGCYQRSARRKWSFSQISPCAPVFNLSTSPITNI